MARIQTWTDAWVRQLKHPTGGEEVHHDPQVSGHRLVVRKTRKVFEVQRNRPLRFGPPKTFKVQTGNGLTTTVEEARTRAIAALGQIASGLDPHPRKEQPVVKTLGSAWAEFKTRAGIRPSTLRLYEDTYKRGLKKWENETLAYLAANPQKARDEHRTITEKRGPRTANMTMTLLRSIYFHAAELDTSLNVDKNGRHPCTAVEFHESNPRENAAIPAEGMARWFEQVEAFRVKSPLRAAFHILCLRLGTRPGELAARKWSDVDLHRKILTLPTSKTYLVEVPLTPQCMNELERVKEIHDVDYPNSDYIFPAREGKHLARFTEPKSALGYSGNCGRHSHHTLGTVLGVEEMVLDVLEGRTLLKAGAAGRGYIDRIELGPKVRAAQQLINDRIDELRAGKVA